VPDWLLLDTVGKIVAMTSEGTTRRSRRAPDPDERQRDAARTRQRILDAALAEFAAKGFAGARVREIAQRAGVNAQLISYYFGGKEGLYNELMANWHQLEAGAYAENMSFADVTATFVQAFAARPELLRMFAWEGLARQSTPGSYYTEPGTESSTGEAPEVADLRRRQAAGEIASDLDPRFLLVFFMGAAMATVTIPDQIERLCQVPADSPEYAELAAAQIRLIIAHLADHGAG
jgi:TetR/AcrR family transcriptional regulator